MTTSRRIFDIQTFGFDPDRAGYGSSAAPGDAGNSALFVPQFIPVSGDRFFFRLLALDLAAGEKLRVLRYRLNATIAQTSPIGSGDTSTDYVTEREIVSPFWSFVDGNITYFLRRVPLTQEVTPRTGALRTPDPSTQRGLYGSAPALLYTEYDPATRLYVPPAAGQPPGEPIGGLGRIGDQHGVWVDTQNSDTVVSGPASLVLYASLRQTDIDTRPMLPAASQPSANYRQGLRPEDQFLFGWGDSSVTNRVRYRHISAGMTVEKTSQECNDDGHGWLERLRSLLR